MPCSATAGPERHAAMRKLACTHPPSAVAPNTMDTVLPQSQSRSQPLNGAHHADAHDEHEQDVQRQVYQVLRHARRQRRPAHAEAGLSPTLPTPDDCHAR